MTGKLYDLIPTRRSLLSRIRNLDDQQAWSEFFETYWRLIYRVARAAGLSDAEAQDVVQETILGVVRKAHGFHYSPERGSFKAWLLKATRWRIADQFKMRVNPAPRKGSEEDRRPPTPELEELPDERRTELQALWDREWDQNLIDLATERVKERTSPSLYQIFDLYVQKGKKPAEVAKALEVPVSQVYLAKLRVSRRLRREYLRLSAAAQSPRL